MMRLIALAVLGSLMTPGAFAMSEASSQYSAGAPQSQLTDPDEKDDFQSQLPSGPNAPNVREQALLGGDNTGQQTYGFNSPDASLSYGFGQSSHYRSR